MKITTFLYREARTHIEKSIGTIASTILLIVLSAGLFFVYWNIVSAVSYYSSSSIVDPRRIEITADDNILTLFSGGKGGIQKQDLENILSNSRLEGSEIFTLVEYPVLAKFSLFSFGLETDIPVFTVSGGSLRDSEIGISQKMLDYYNSQFAGSSVMFPEMNAEFLIGQPVTITVGNSKLFNIGGTPASPLNAHVANISPDYPGFGLVLREDMIAPKLREIGQSLGNPYKITTYMKSSLDKEAIKSQYKNLHLTFDSDKISELGRKMDAIQLIFLIIFGIVGGIVTIIIVFLLGGIFREMVPTYRIMHTFGIGGTQARWLTLGEPLGLLAVGIIISGIILFGSTQPLANMAGGFLTGRGLVFPMHSLSGLEISSILGIIFIFLIIILIALDSRMRKI